MNAFSMRRPAVFACLATMVALDASVALAQSDALEEIVVTARRRAESFQDVPVTITAFSEQDIRDAGIERPQDFVSLTPNMTLVETQNQGTAFVQIRGISQARNSEPSVAVLVDGVLLTNPAQLTQELFDVQQIEVLKGAQGAVYGRNAIGGAVVVTTNEPGDEFEGKIRVGADSGPGYRAQLMGGGPLGDSDTLKYQAGFSFLDTDGFIDNEYLDEKADPYQDMSARVRLLWEPNDRLRTDARFYVSEVETQALYFNIVGDLFDPSVPQDVNDTSLPVRVNNEGINNRDLSQLAFKLDYDLDFGTFTSITSYDTIEEILTGDQFNFLPIDESAFMLFFGDDWAQSQYLDVETFSQEFRFTSNDDGPFRWIAGAYFVGTDRYISTGNIVDRGEGAFPVYETPRGNFPFDNSVYTNSFQTTFLADSQDNFAWAVFGEVVADVTDNLELSFALRYDEDERENTTETPAPFLASLPSATSGEVRTNTWDELQPRLAVRYQPSDNLTLFGALSRGFRSGGFNQSGVGDEAAAAGILGVGDLFDAEVADSIEFGVKGVFADNRVNANFSVFSTVAEGSYFFVFLATSSTQNLGNLTEVEYQGFDFDVTWSVSDYVDLYFGYGYTDSEITESVDPGHLGNQAPLVTKDTINAGVQYRQPLGGSNLDFFLRADYQRLGDTWWEPFNTTVRDPVDLIDLRVGVEAESWSVIGWGRNVSDELYNAEFSPGGFVFKAKPQRWGIDFTKYF